MMAGMAETAPDRTPDAWTAGAPGYEQAFAPFTGLYADEALRLTGVQPGDEVLDVAAGSGALSLRAARLGARVLATDFAPGMVELLRQRFADEGLTNASAEVMDGQALEVESGRFDAAFSKFGVIFFPDIDAGLRELARAVRSGGKVCVSTWRLETFRMSDLVGAAIARALPDAAEPGPAPEPPWAHIGHASGLDEALRAAGLVDVEVHTITRHFDSDDPAGFFRALPSWSPPTLALFEAVPQETIEVAAQAFAELVGEADDDGKGVAIDALLGVGQAP
jgi:SAM-dependent methyltransferase